MSDIQFSDGIFPDGRPPKKSPVAAIVIGLLVLGAASFGIWWMLRDEPVPPVPVAIVAVDAGNPVDAGPPPAEHSVEEGNTLLAEAPQGGGAVARLKKLLKRDGMLSALVAAVNL